MERKLRVGSSPTLSTFVSISCSDPEGRGAQVEALRGLTMVVNTGEFTAISGPSGSGKTTALNLIGALDTPTSGTVRIDGTDLGTLNRKELSRLRRDRIGFVFQSYNLLPILSAYENAEIVMAVQGVDEAERRRRVMELLARVGLEGLEDRRPSELSGRPAAARRDREGHRGQPGCRAGRRADRQRRFAHR